MQIILYTHIPDLSIYVLVQCKTSLASTTILQPGIVGTGAGTFPATEIPDGRVAAEAFENNANLLLSGELAAGDALDVADKLLGF